MKNPSAKIKTTADMKAVYDEFGINVHEVPQNIQPQLNALIKALIKERGEK